MHQKDSILPFCTFPLSPPSLLLPPHLGLLLLCHLLQLHDVVDDVVVDRVAGHEGVDLVLTEGTERFVANVVGVNHWGQLLASLSSKLPSEVPTEEREQGE